MKKFKYIFIIILIIILLALIKLPSKNNEIYIEDKEIENVTNKLAIYVENESGAFVSSSSIPNKGTGYFLDENQSMCDGQATIKWNNSSWSAQIANISKDNINCYLYFRKGTPSEQTLTKLEETKGGDNYIILPMPTIDSIADATQVSNTLYTAEDNYGTSYVFRGNVQDNWVQFANKRWRIIRINGDGTLRLIYQCGSTSCTDTTGNNTQINGSTNIAYEARYSDNTYVGYYNQNGTTSKYPDAHKGTNPSTIASYINTWYSGTGAMTGYTKYLSGNTGFCNDRQIAQVSRSSYYNTGYGGGSSNATAYAAVDRFYDSSWSWLGTQTPDLRCGVDPKTKAVDKAALQRDLYTTSDETGEGNGILTYPVGLITVDEVAMAGGKGGTANSSYYLYTNKYYWTMSPYDFNTSGLAYVFYVLSGGGLGSDFVRNPRGVRPVINLKANITFSGGNGTSGSPFVVAT